MKLTYWPIFVVLSLFTFTSALPVDIGGKVNELQMREVEEESASAVDFALDKREIKALTVLFQSINNTAGIQLIKGACTNALTQPQIIKFVGNLVEEKSLETLLQVADQSGLGLDIVLLILTHYETIPGVTKIIKQYKGTASSGNSTSTDSGSSSSGLSGGLLGGILGGIGSIFGIGGSSSSSSSPSASSSPKSSSTAAPTNNGSSSSSGGLLGGLLNGIGGIFGLNSGSQRSSPSSSASRTTATPAAAGATTATAPGLDLLSGLTTPTGTTTPPVVTGTPAVVVATTTSRTSTSTPAAAATTTAGGPISNLIGTVTGLFGFVKREDLDTFLMNEGMHDILRRNNFPVDEALAQVYARSEDDQELAKRDLLDVLYSQIIAIVGTNSNIEDIAESLQKSGLAVNVIYNAIVDSGWYNFDVSLVKYLVNNKIVTGSGLISAVFSLGIALSIVGDIIGNTTYLRYVINFVLAVLSGQIDVFSLILALF